MGVKLQEKSYQSHDCIYKMISERNIFFSEKIKMTRITLCPRSLQRYPNVDYLHANSVTASLNLYSKACA